MANYHAVYIDSPSSWTYAPDSYDSKLGFYTNAWLTNQSEEDSETPIISCSYFYEIGKEDDVGFTPRRINYNSGNGILTVEGKQAGVPSLVSKSFRKKSPSPRFLNLRESLRKRRPARFMVSEIITDDNDGLMNIKKYLGIDQEDEEMGAEEFEAEQVQFDVLKGKPSEGGSDYGEYISIHDSYDEAEEEAKKVRKNLADDEEVYIIEEVFDDETFDSIRSTKLISMGKTNEAEGFEAPQATINSRWAMRMIQSQYDNVGIDRVLSVREDFEGDLFITILLTNGNKQQLIIEKSQIGMAYDEDKGEYVRMDAEEFDEAGYPLNMDRFSYQNEGKVIGIGGKELRQYRIYFGKEPMFYLNDAVFGYDNNNTVQEVVDDLNEALQDSIKEVFQRLLWKSQRPDSLDVMLRGEEFGADSFQDDTHFVLIHGEKDGEYVVKGHQLEIEEKDGFTPTTITTFDYNPKAGLLTEGLMNFDERVETIDPDFVNRHHRSQRYRGEEFGAEVHLYNDGEYEYGMGFITSNKDKYREKMISSIQDSRLMADYEPTKKDIKEGYPTGDYSSTWRKQEKEWLSKKSDAQLKKMLKKAYPYGSEKKVDLDEKVLNIAGNRKGLDIELEAEEFGAEEDEKAERIMKLLRIVKRKATGSNARYAKTYADAAEMAYYDYGFKGLKTQVAYVLSNLGGWRGDEAKQVKAELRKLMK